MVNNKTDKNTTMENIIALTDSMIITYNGKEYPARYIANGALISVEQLGEALMTEDGNFADDIAEYLDSTICGFVSDEEIILSDEALENLCRGYGIID